MLQPNYARVSLANIVASQGVQELKWTTCRLLRVKIRVEKVDIGVDEIALDAKSLSFR